MVKNPKASLEIWLKLKIWVSKIARYKNQKPKSIVFLYVRKWMLETIIK